jgi:RNA polymerase sigma-70 factor, ECF subfamily
MAEPAARDENLLRTLYEEHGAPLLAYSERLVGGDHQQAEDIVQETLLRAWRLGDRLDRRHARRWLYTVARNLAIDRYRARRARPPQTDDAPLIGLAAPDELEQALLSWQVGDALRALKPAHRQVLIEVFYRDRSVAQAAAALRIPEGTVKSRTYFALRALRRALEERGVTSP